MKSFRIFLACDLFWSLWICQSKIKKASVAICSYVHYFLAQMPWTTRAPDELPASPGGDVTLTIGNDDELMPVDGILPPLTSKDMPLVMSGYDIKRTGYDSIIWCMTYNIT